MNFLCDCGGYANEEYKCYRCKRLFDKHQCDILGEFVFQIVAKAVRKSFGNSLTPSTPMVDNLRYLVRRKSGIVCFSFEIKNFIATLECLEPTETPEVSGGKRTWKKTFTPIKIVDQFEKFSEITVDLVSPKSKMALEQWITKTIKSIKRC